MQNTEYKNNNIYESKLKQITNIIYKNTLITDNIIGLKLETTKPAKEVILTIYYTNNPKDKIIKFKQIKLN
jgi:hypothetical protein